MKKFAITSVLLALSMAVLVASEKTSNKQFLLRFGPGPVKPWMLASCTDPVINAAPLFGQFANDTINQDVEELCLDVAELQAPLYNISHSCWIGDFQYANTTGTLNASALLGIANGLLASAQNINANPTPIYGVSNDIQNFIDNYYNLVTNCD